MLTTILLVLAAGIGLSYLTVSGILYAFGHNSQKQRAALATAAAAGSSGD